MLESPSPVLLLSLSGSQGRSPVRLKLISVLTGFECFQRDVPQMRFIGVYCAPSVLNSPWYLPADLPSSLTDISGLGFAFFLSDLQSRTQMGI